MDRMISAEKEKQKLNKVVKYSIFSPPLPGYNKVINNKGGKNRNE